MKRLIKMALHRLGIDLVRYAPPCLSKPDSAKAIPELPRQIISRVAPFSMTGNERITALVDAVTYLVQNEIPGDIAECGVWRGGSMMAVALTLMAHGDRGRMLYLYDTFEGMSSPTAQDVDLNGMPAAKLLERDVPGTGIWCYASMDDVRANMVSTGYPEERIHLVKGKVENTLPSLAPSRLSMLRLDTDWYASTKHELEHLYPLLNDKGVLIIDDYDHWQGAKKAVDEYFQARGEKVYLHRIDYSGRIMIRAGR